MSTLEATEGALLNREKVYQRMCCAAVLALFRRHKCPLKPCQRGGEWIVMAVGSRGAFDGPSGGLRTKTRVHGQPIDATVAGTGREGSNTTNE